MKTLRASRLAALSVVLALPALVLTTSGVLSEFGLGILDERLAAFGRTLSGKVFFSPVLVLGGVLATLALNLWAACRLRVGVDTGTVYVTFWIARAPRHLLAGAITLVLITVLLIYGFVENFRIVPI